MQELNIFAKIRRFLLKQMNKFDEILCKFHNMMAAIIDAYPNFVPHDILSRIRKALQGWKKIELQRTRPPIYWILLANIIIDLLKSNRKTIAIAILLIFTGCLKSAEVLAIQRRDLIIPVPGCPLYVFQLNPAERE